MQRVQQRPARWCRHTLARAHPTTRGTRSPDHDFSHSVPTLAVPLPPPVSTQPAATLFSWPRGTLGTPWPAGPCCAARAFRNNPALNIFSAVNLLKAHILSVTRLKSLWKTSNLNLQGLPWLFGLAGKQLWFQPPRGTGSPSRSSNVVTQLTLWYWARDQSVRWRHSPAVTSAQMCTSNRGARARARFITAVSAQLQVAGEVLEERHACGRVSSALDQAAAGRAAGACMRLRSTEPDRSRHRQ